MSVTDNTNTQTNEDSTTHEETTMTVESLQETLKAKEDALNDLTKQFEAIKNKNEELLSETKRAKQKAREEQEEKEKAKLEKAKREGDFESLLKASEASRAELQKQLHDIQNNIKTEKIKTMSMKIATELADGDAAELLSEFVKAKLFNVETESGEFEETTISAIKNTFENDPKFKIFLRGTKARGGDSIGSKPGATRENNKTMSRAEFDALTPDKKHKALVIDKIKLTD